VGGRHRKLSDGIFRVAKGVSALNDDTSTELCLSGERESLQSVTIEATFLLLPPRHLQLYPSKALKGIT
jgi:hypothetical protein